MVLIAGPSSSGKTTFTKRLAVQLLTNLLNPVMISLDNYFVDRNRTRVTRAAIMTMSRSLLSILSCSTTI